MVDSFKRWWVVGVGFLGIMGLTLAGFWLWGDLWSAWRPATCWPGACFCEAIRPSTIRQPVNTWSSLAFALVGLLIFHDKPDRRANLLGREYIYRWLLAGALLIIGVGSAFYHASLTFVGQWWDVFGMYLLATYMLMYTAARIWPRRSFLWALIYVFANMVLAAELILIPEVRRFAFAGLLISAIVWEIWYARRPFVQVDIRYITRGLLWLSLAFGVWLLDWSGIWCLPKSLLQGHAIWHMLGAGASYELYRYYRSEESSKSDS